MTLRKNLFVSVSQTTDFSLIAHHHYHKKQVVDIFNCGKYFASLINVPNFFALLTVMSQKPSPLHTITMLFTTYKI